MNQPTFPFVAVAVACFAASARADGPVLRSVPQTAPTAVSIAVTFAVFALGVILFSRTEKTFMDTV